MAKICLNMIVKNESAILRRLLESVLPLIDSYCICDTGSTDDTIEIKEKVIQNNGKDPYPLLLRRGKVNHNFEMKF